MSGLHVSNIRISTSNRELFLQTSLNVPFGQSVAIVGPSGSGKSSLLTCLAGIHRPDGGEIALGDVTFSDLNVNQRANLRLSMIGMVFQFGELLPELSVLENVSLPLLLLGSSQSEAKKRAKAQLAALGIADLVDRLPDSISGGEVQRTAIARALVSSPLLVLADEPTGALDAENALVVSKLLVSRAKEAGAAVVIATHDPIVARAADDVYVITNANLEKRDGIQAS